MPPEKPSSPPSIPQSFPFLPSFLHFFISSATFYWGGIWWFQLFCQKKLVQFFLVQIEQKRTGDMKPTSPAALTRRTWADLWVMIWSVYRCNPHPPITSHLSHGVWSHEEVNYCKELQEVLFFFLSTLKIIPKSARGKGLYNPYLIVIMYITMDTLINKTMSKSMEVTLKVYT